MALASCFLRCRPLRTVRALRADELVEFGQGKRPREGVDLPAAGARRNFLGVEPNRLSLPFNLSLWAILT